MMHKKLYSSVFTQKMWGSAVGDHTVADGDPFCLQPQGPYFKSRNSLIVCATGGKLFMYFMSVFFVDP